MRRPDLQVAARALSVAALVLAVTSRGDATVLAVVLVLADLRPATVVAVGAAFTASSWRWGSSSLDALAGAQAVLGPAVTVGPASAAAGSGLAGLALLLALARGTDPLRAAAIGATVAAVLAGPGSGGAIAVRAGVAVVVAVVALGLGALVRAHRRIRAGLAVLAVLVGIAAVTAVAPDAPAWPPRVAPDGLAQGAAVAVAVAAAALVGLSLVDGARWSRGWVPPRLRRSDARRTGVPIRSR